MTYTLKKTIAILMAIFILLGICFQNTYAANELKGDAEVRINGEEVYTLSGFEEPFTLSIAYKIPEGVDQVKLRLPLHGLFKVKDTPNIINSNAFGSDVSLSISDDEIVLTADNLEEHIDTWVGAYINLTLKDNISIDEFISRLGVPQNGFFRDDMSLFISEDGEDENDSAYARIRIPAPQEEPSITEEEITKTVTRTITYWDGTTNEKIFDDVIQTVTFRGTKRTNAETGEVTEIWENESETMPEVTSPDYEGYSADKEKVESTAKTPQSEDEEVKVTYMPEDSFHPDETIPELIINKKDNKGNSLDGAEFTMSGNNSQVKTSENGKVTFTLPTGEFSNLTFYENAAPFGFSCGDDKYYVTVKRENANTTVKVERERNGVREEVPADVKTHYAYEKAESKITSKDAVKYDDGMHKVSNEVIAYCIDPRATVPTNENISKSSQFLNNLRFTDENEWLTSLSFYNATLVVQNGTSGRNTYANNLKNNVEQMSRLILLGYPNDVSGFKEKYNLTDTEYYKLTKAALFKYALDTTELNGESTSAYHIATFIRNYIGGDFASTGGTRFNPTYIIDPRIEELYNLSKDSSIELPTNYSLPLYALFNDNGTTVGLASIVNNDVQTSVYQALLGALPVVEVVDSITIDVENTPIKIETNASGEDGNKEIYASDEAVVVDHINYSGLQKDTPYYFKGKIVSKETGDVVAEATGNTFYSDGEGQGEMTFRFDANNLSGDIVVYEYLYSGDKMIAKHENIDDGNQTVRIKVPEPEPSEVVISKVILGQGDELPDAHLSVNGSNLNEPIQWVSTTEPHKIMLLPGEYTLTETTAPNGYLVAEDITFVVDDEGNVRNSDGSKIDKVIMEDAPSASSLTVKKITENNVPGEFQFNVKIWNDEPATKNIPLGQLEEYWVTGNTRAFTLYIDEDFTANGISFSKGSTITDQSIIQSVSSTLTRGGSVTYKGNTYTTFISMEDVRDGLPALYFNIKVLTGDTVPKYKNLSSYGGVSKGNGVYQFTIRNNESFVITDIENGCKYEVVEAEKEGWIQVSKENDMSDGITGNTTATFTNKQTTYTLPYTGSAGWYWIVITGIILTIISLTNLKLKRK